MNKINWIIGKRMKYVNAIMIHPAKYFHILLHYNDVIMGVIASQITSLTIVYSIVH